MLRSSDLSLASQGEPDLLTRYLQVRLFTSRLCAPLVDEDYVVQSMPEVSPIKWHLAHTSWFFEELVLRAALHDFQPYNPHFAYLFNSYYNSLGPQFPRPRRGLLSRPTVAEVYAYRDWIDGQMTALLELPGRALGELQAVIQLGLHHEQQHQELMLTDIKHIFSLNPLEPRYREVPAAAVPAPVPALEWIDFEKALYLIGSAGPGFAFDNEGPQHRQLVEAFQLASRPVTCGEWLAFMQQGGYATPDYWLAAGWETVQREAWRSPLYWREQPSDEWSCWTLGGWQPLDPAEPVCHVSCFEADAYARWAGARLPTEAEWELAAAPQPIVGNFVESGRYHPAAAVAPDGAAPAQLYGDVWEWTASPYLPYPGYRPAAGPLGEYNGKFMCNQLVLRGGSCATSASHLRPTYRNFFPPETRWQFSGLRLARDRR